MLGFLSAYDENEKQATKEKIVFVPIISENKEDIEIELSPLALNFARHFDIEKVFLFYGKEKIVYDYTLQLQMEKA